MYLDFNTYKEMSGKLKEPEFNRAEMSACSKIDTMTFNRLQAFFEELPKDDKLSVKVKFLVFELVERKLTGSLDGKEVTSESNDGRSRSYESSQGKAENLIRDYLTGEKDRKGIPLLYAGNE